jgi:hypothetical protein
LATALALFGWVRAPRMILGDRFGSFWLVAGSKNDSWRPPRFFLAGCGLQESKNDSWRPSWFFFVSLRAQKLILRKQTQKQLKPDKQSPHL